jgi:hypothetical protein
MTPEQIERQRASKRKYMARQRLENPEKLKESSERCLTPEKVAMYRKSYEERLKADPERLTRRNEVKKVWRASNAERIRLIGNNSAAKRSLADGLGIPIS